MYSHHIMTSEQENKLLDCLNSKNVIIFAETDSYIVIYIYKIKTVN